MSRAIILTPSTSVPNLQIAAIFIHRFLYEEAAFKLLKFWEGLDKFTLHLTLLPLNKGLAAWGSPAALESARTVPLHVHVRDTVKKLFFRV